MKKQSNNCIVGGIIILILFSSSLNKASAQSDNFSQKWHFLTDVYLIFPYMNGETAVINQIIVPVDENPSDIFGKLKMAAMFYIEAHSYKWAITSDFIFMNLSQDVTPGALIKSGDITGKQLIWETTGLYRLLPFWELGVGGRLNDISSEINALIDINSDTQEINMSGSKIWFDPLVIARLTGDIHEKWLFQFRGDVGGFGVGSNFTWQLQAYTGYRFTKVFQLTAGYRILSIDYDKGTGADRFIYNVDISGPVIRAGFNF